MRRAIALVVLLAGIATTAGSAANGIRVASGRSAHVEWTLLADDGKSGSFSITMLVGKRLSASEGGTLNMQGTRAITYLAHQGRPSPNYIAGPVISTATHVVITYANGLRVSVPTIPAPTGLASNLSFYVHITGCQTLRATRIAGLNAHGRIVASMTLPARLGPRAAC